MSIFDLTYELIENPPPAMSWDEYEQTTLREWNALISGPSATDEAAIHRFLELNPSMVPGAYSFPLSGHGPIYSGVFSKPPLNGVGMRVPDFMWLATATDIIFPMFIEIETPAKRWFTANGQPRAEFTQARNQLVGWKQWFNRPANRLVFFETYGIQGRVHNFEIQPQFVLVYGRRQEFDERPELRGTRAQQRGDDEYHVSFDHLVPDHNARNFLTLRKAGNDTAAIVFPPTVRLGPGIATTWLEVGNRIEAALAEERISPERRRFLADRIPYWDAWARRGDIAYQVGHWE